MLSSLRICSQLSDPTATNDVGVRSLDQIRVVNSNMRRTGEEVDDSTEAVICTSASKPPVPGKHQNSLVGQVPSRTARSRPSRGGPNGKNGTAGFCGVSTKTQTQGNGWFPTKVLRASKSRGFNILLADHGPFPQRSADRKGNRAAASGPVPASGCDRANTCMMRQTP